MPKLCYKMTLSESGKYSVEQWAFYFGWSNWFRSKFNSSCLEVFCEKGVIRNFVKFTGKHLCQSLFFDKAAGMRQDCKYNCKLHTKRKKENSFSQKKYIAELHRDIVLQLDKIWYNTLTLHLHINIQDFVNKLDKIEDIMYPF